MLQTPYFWQWPCHKYYRATIGQQTVGGAEPAHHRPVCLAIGGARGGGTSPPHPPPLRPPSRPVAHYVERLQLLARNVPLNE